MNDEFWNIFRAVWNTFRTMLVAALNSMFYFNFLLIFYVDVLTLVSDWFELPSS